ncbi:DUF547 domain-containing protein [Pontibacter cellulosilyticus]|uniref:DUF547 domain-containing protein n=1 Tax=Pontibacter cellulosilyticus TaxID=1720253 RepID=A0A923NBC6_9BACT|nr:DUF547 domain-containing protein [Pontibacter cellulosilyticus]MBC5994292.1 DUF547 domain-containing protein [Pontibacter cellulosilyticus]
MFRLLFLYVLLFGAVTTVDGSNKSTASYEMRQQGSFYTSVTNLLQKYVKDGQVKYKALQQDVPRLEQLAKQIAAYDLSKASGAEKKAFYINAYNVLVLRQVMEHYPLKSVIDVPGFFDKQKYKVAGEYLTLNELEKKKLLLPYKDARIHFALVCAAKSCPPLLDEAYTPELVEKQLEAQTRLALNNSTFMKVQPKQVQVSEIFKWYEADFLAEAPGILAYINKYRNKPIPKQNKVGYYTYNWALNESVE